MSKTILVTGGAGFVGSNLCRRLFEMGYKVISLDNYFTGSSENHVSGVEYREGHTKDIAKLIPEHIDLIYHLGEYSRVEQSLQEPEIVWDFNVQGTLAVLEFWRMRRCKLVYAGSSSKFSDGGMGRNLTPYTWTKASNTELVKNYASWYDLPFAITYFYNVYGPGEIAYGPYSTLISIFTQETLHGQPLSVVAPGTQMRNFTHVEDTVEGLVLVGEKGHGDEYGIGAQESFSILDAAKMFGGAVVMLPERAGNRQTSAVDSSKIRSLGWRQARQLDTYVRELRANMRVEKTTEKRILVFTTTFYPHEGPAEKALVQLAQNMPDVHFDVITTLFSERAVAASSPASNITVHRVGRGFASDKYLLPILAYKKARELSFHHSYVFAWSVMASYGTIAAIRFKKLASVPLLISLADQKIAEIPAQYRFAMNILLNNADQISTSSHAQKNAAQSIGLRVASSRAGDVFANQIRFIYNSFLRDVA
jgi:UDP-glucose 4-epimerase